MFVLPNTGTDADPAFDEEITPSLTFQMKRSAPVKFAFGVYSQLLSFVKLPACNTVPLYVKVPFVGADTSVNCNVCQLSAWV